jgi:hypothetical protein
MAKDGVFGSAEKGWDVYVNGDYIGWYKWKSMANKAFREEKERIARRGAKATKMAAKPTPGPAAQPAAAAPAPSKPAAVPAATPAGPSKAGQAARAAGRGLLRAGGWLKAAGAGVGGFVAGRLTGGGGGEGPKQPASKGVAWFFFFASLGLYAMDWATGYNGIEIAFFTNLGGIDWLYKSGILTVFLIIFLFQFIFAKPKSQEEFRYNLYLDAVLAFVFIVARYSAGALYHAIFILAIWYFLLKPVKTRIDANKTLIVLILIDFLLFSALEYLFANIGFLRASGLIANYIIFPVFSLYILGYLKAYGSKLGSFLLFFILLLYIFGFVRNSPQYQTLSAEIDEKQKEEAWGFWKTSFFRAKEFGGMLLDPIGCSSLMGVSHSDYENCLRERQYDRLCAEKGRGTEEYNNCINQKKGLDVAGTTDKTITEFTKVEFKKPKEFPRQIQREFAPPIPMQLDVESPKRPITIELSCKFKTDSQEIEGDIQPQDIEEITGTKKQTILCDLPDDVEYQELKNYRVTYTARIEGIETESTLTRLFVGKELDEKEINSLLSLHGLTVSESSKSPESFAAFSFGIGTPPTSPFIDDKPAQVLIGNVENLANGRILAVENIQVNLIEGITPTPACLRAFSQQGNLLVLKPEARDRLRNLALKQGERFFLLGCNLLIAQDLAQTTDYIKRGFSSTMTYTYEIKQEASFSVAKSFTIT